MVYKFNFLPDDSIEGVVQRQIVIFNLILLPTLLLQSSKLVDQIKLALRCSCSSRAASRENPFHSFVKLLLSIALGN